MNSNDKRRFMNAFMNSAFNLNYIYYFHNCNLCYIKKKKREKG